MAVIKLKDEKYKGFDIKVVKNGKNKYNVLIINKNNNEKYRDLIIARNKEKLLAMIKKELDKLKEVKKYNICKLIQIELPVVGIISSSQNTTNNGIEAWTTYEIINGDNKCKFAVVHYTDDDKVIVTWYDTYWENGKKKSRESKKEIYEEEKALDYDEDGVKESFLQELEDNYDFDLNGKNWRILNKLHEKIDFEEENIDTWNELLGDCNWYRHRETDTFGVSRDYYGAYTWIKIKCKSEEDCEKIKNALENVTGYINCEGD